MPITPKDLDSIPVGPSNTLIQARHEYSTTQNTPTPPATPSTSQIPRPSHIYPSSIASHPSQSASTEPIEAIFVGQITIKDALEAVPYFDGNKDAFRQFAEGCREAREMINPQMELSLVRLIKNRLKGTPKECMEGNTFTTVESLIQFLEKIFSPPQSLSCLQGKLSRVVQQSSETVAAYGTRVMKLLNLIIETQRKTCRQESHEARLDAEIEAIKCFARGLKRGLHINPAKFNNLTLAICAAVDAETEKQLCDELHGCLQGEKAAAKSKYQTKESGKQGQSRKTDNPSTCSHCNKIGHTEENCWAKHGKPPNSRNDKFCNYCKNKGHEIADCRKKKYNEKYNIASGNEENLSKNGGQREDQKRNTANSHGKSSSQQ